jgi:hypothetical protein
MRKNYKIQEHDRECSNCRHFDSIKEEIWKGEHKVRVMICRLDHLPIDKQGVCDNWRAK